MNDKHKTVDGDSDYVITLHPGFASECTHTRKSSNGVRKLYQQTEVYHCGDEGHPTRHQIVVTEKNGARRTLTITVDDPSHILHSISLDLYEEGRDPAKKKDWKSDDTITVLNTADTCPPHCEG